MTSEVTDVESSNVGQKKILEDEDVILLDDDDDDVVPEIPQTTESVTGEARASELEPMQVDEEIMEVAQDDEVDSSGVEISAVSTETTATDEPTLSGKQAELIIGLT